MIRLLTERGLSLSSTAEREIVRDVKEKLCYVALDYEKELASAISSNSIEKEYVLPDGHCIQVGSERFRCPEALFNPSLIGREEGGVTRLLYDTIMRCDIDVRRELYGNIVLSGGLLKFPKKKKIVRCESV